MFKRIAIAIAAMTLMGAAPISAETAQLPTYSVSMKIYDGGKLILSPRLVTQGGESASFVKSDGRFFLQLVATPTVDGQFSVNSSLVKWSQSGLFSDGSTLVVAADGKPNRIMLGQPNPRTGAARTTQVEIVISPSAR